MIMGGITEHICVTTVTGGITELGGVTIVITGGISELGFGTTVFPRGITEHVLSPLFSRSVPPSLVLQTL